MADIKEKMCWFQEFQWFPLICLSHLKWLQFFVHLAFAMTINKALEQSLHVVSLNSVNNNIHLKIPGAITEYKSIESLWKMIKLLIIQSNFSIFFEPPAILPHKLMLKISSSILLLWNLNTTKFCNGTRLEKTAAECDWQA